jgi:predicted SAM-dependent methyltransferase
MLKEKIKKLARLLAGLPIIGRFTRIAVAVIRLPQFREEYLSLRQEYLSLNHRQHIFETSQLPTLLQTLSDLNNLAHSVPVALRKSTRDLSDLRGQVENLSDLRGQVENLSDLRGQVENLSGSIHYLLGRVEFVRRELMFEMRYGVSDSLSQGSQIKAQSKILSPDKLLAFRKEKLKLNLGCGHIPLQDYLNVDRRELPGVDIVAEVDELPFECGEIDEIFSAHLLEHFPQEHLNRKLLPYLFQLLREGGKFRAVVPDAESMIKEYSKGDYQYDDMREVIYGAQDYDGDFHFNMFTPLSLEKILKASGFEQVTLLDSARRNGKCFEFEILAIKPKGDDNV